MKTPLWAAALIAAAFSVPGTGRTQKANRPQIEPHWRSAAPPVGVVQHALSKGAPLKISIQPRKMGANLTLAGVGWPFTDRKPALTKGAPAEQAVLFPIVVATAPAARCDGAFRWSTHPLKTVKGANHCVATLRVDDGDALLLSTIPGAKQAVLFVPHHFTPKLNAAGTRVAMQIELPHSGDGSPVTDAVRKWVQAPMKEVVR